MGKITPCWFRTYSTLVEQQTEQSGDIDGYILEILIGDVQHW